MKKIAQLTRVLLSLRPSPEPTLTLAMNEKSTAAKVARESSIPREFLLSDLCEKRTFRRLARKLSAFIALLVFYSTALLMDRNVTRRYAIAQTMSKELLETSLAPSGITFAAGIADTEAFWDWFSNSFVAMVYATKASTGLPRTNEQLYTIGSRYKIIGGFHTTQQRYMTVNSSSTEHMSDLCYSTIAAGKNQVCFSTKGYSTDPFGVVSDTGNATELESLDMFQHSVNFFGGKGFQTYFQRSSTGGAAEAAKVQLMRAYRWIDDQTRTVEIDMSLYNLHLKTGSVIRMTVEFPLTGGIATSAYVFVMDTQPYNLDVAENLLRVVYEIIYASLVVLYAASELWNILAVSRGNLRKYIVRYGVFETVGELTAISTNVMVVLARWSIMTDFKRQALKVISFDNYAPLMVFADEDEAFVNLNIVNAMVLLVRALKFFQVTDGGQRLLSSVSGAMPDIVSFLPIYITVLVVYAHTGHLIFGLTFPEWSTFLRALCRVIEMNFGLYDPGAIYDTGTAFSFVYTASASIVFCIIMLNVFLAIIMSTWDMFTAKEAEKARVREKYRARMSLHEIVGLIFLSARILDALVAMVATLEDHETVNRQLFEQSFPEVVRKLPAFARKRIVRWYWNSNDTAHVGPTAQVAHRGTMRESRELPSSEPVHHQAKSTMVETVNRIERRLSTARMKKGYAPSMRKIPSFMLSSASAAAGAAALARPDGIPRDFLLRDLKEKRKFRLLARKLTVFVTFVTVYLAVLLLDRNISGRSVVRQIISKELIESSQAASGIRFAAIDSVGAFWDWFANSFLTSVYSTVNSDGLERSDDELYTIAAHTKIVGGFHIIQTRYAAVNTSTAEPSADPCRSYLAPTVNQTCFTAARDASNSFGVSNGTAASAAELLRLEMFRYSTNNDSVSGFQTYFLRSATSGADERAVVARMRSHRWIDRQTKLVEITMPLYNSNLKIWSIVNLKVAFNLAGGITPTSFIHVANLEPYNTHKPSNVVRMVLEAIFVLHVVYFVLMEFWDICVLSSGNLQTYVMKYGLLNNLGDWANIAINVAIIGWRYLCQNNATRASMLAITSFDEYVSALSLAQWDDNLLVLNVCNMLLLTARALKYFQVTDGGRRLMNSVYGAMPDVLSFLPIYFAVLIGYTFVGHMLYGLRFLEWSTFPGAFFRVFELNFGLYDPGPIYDANGYLSVVFIYTSTVVFCILMLNVFMAIVMSTWESLAAREAEKAAERAHFSRRLGPLDLAFLLLMNEDIVDLLIDVVLGLESGNDDVVVVSKKAFADAWTATGYDVSAWTWATIVSWYWDDRAPHHLLLGDGEDNGGASADRLRSKRQSRVSVKQQPSLSALTDDTVVPKSAKLSLNASAKVFAADEG